MSISVPCAGIGSHNISRKDRKGARRATGYSQQTTSV